MGVFTPAGRNMLLDGTFDRTLLVASAHSADPGTTGANEVSTSRPASAFAAAVGAAISLSAPPVSIPVPVGATVTWVGFWQGTTLVAKDDFPPRSYPAGGPCVVNAATLAAL